MISVPEILKRKEKNPLTMVTCYDHWSAKLLNATDVDLILVGDSLVMVMYGADDTTQATMDMMVQHTRAVRKGAPNKFIVADMPFMSFRKSLETSIDNATALIQAGANAVKLEGAQGNLELVERFSSSGIPVMGHLGLTPQFIHNFGGFKVQGKSEAAKNQILKDAVALERAGAFSLVLECIPQSLASEVRSQLSIPTIGIGAGLDCDGQVLVLHDLLGFTSGKKPRFVREFCQGRGLVHESVQQFQQAVLDKNFPSSEETYE